MCIAVVQNRCQDMWISVEPYVIPSVIASGVVFVVNQLWGNIAAICFAAGAVGIGAAFPFIVTQITKDDAVMGFARLVLIAVLPFFGPYGIVGSVGLSVAFSLARDIRLYAIRAKIAEADAITTTIENKHKELMEARKSMIAECDKKNADAENYWRSARPVDAVYQALERYEGMTKDNQAFFIKTIERMGASDNHEAAGEIIEDIKKFKEHIDSLMVKNLEIKKSVAAALLQMTSAQQLGVSRGNN